MGRLVIILLLMGMQLIASSNSTQKEYFSEIDINLYPTSSSTSFNLSFNNSSVIKADIIIYDILGNIVKKMYSQEIETGQVLSVDVSNLEHGNYFVKISGDRFNDTKRFTKN